MNFQTLLTDNATLTDAALGFYSLANNLNLSPSIIPNWLKFLENSILYDEMVADSNVFDSQIWTLQLKESFNHIQGINIEHKTRQKINESANSRIKELDEISFDGIHDNNVRSNVKRTLFYLGLANEINSTYSPSDYRNSIIQSIANLYHIEDTKTALEARILENVISAAKSYADNVEKESGFKIVVAELPPISSLVINHAVKCGSWAEAIFEIKQKEGARHFREWAAEVTENLHNVNNNALAKLSKVNRFIDGWGKNSRDGIDIRINFGIGTVLNLFKIPIKTDELSLSVPNPFAAKHVLFLNESFQSAVSADYNWKKLKEIQR